MQNIHDAEKEKLHFLLFLAVQKVAKKQLRGWVEVRKGKM